MQNQSSPQKVSPNKRPITELDNFVDLTIEDEEPQPKRARTSVSSFNVEEEEETFVIDSGSDTDIGEDEEALLVDEEPVEFPNILRIDSQLVICKYLRLIREELTKAVQKEKVNFTEQEVTQLQKLIRERKALTERLVTLVNENIGAFEIRPVPRKKKEQVDDIDDSNAIVKPYEEWIKHEDLINAARIQLKQVFKFDDFREIQAGAIAAALFDQHLLVIMSTGAGKSLIYQLPAIMSRKTTIVVSPLVALMSDQVRAMQERKIPCISLSDELSVAEQKRRWRLMNSKGYKIILISPERFNTAPFKALFERLDSRREIDRIVIDEAHCISQWGYVFAISTIEY
jgi:superfamily II RNA helicase